MLNSLWTRNIHLKNEMLKKIEKLLYIHVQIKNKVAEPDISAGLLFSGSVLKYGV